MSVELIEWLRARLDEDEAKVAAMQREQVRVATAPIFQGYPLGWLGGVDIFVSPDRWRAEIEATRRLILRYERAVAVPPSMVMYTLGQDRGYAEACLDAIRDRAEAYAGHPGYREDWRP